MKDLLGHGSNPVGFAPPVGIADRYVPAASSGVQNGYQRFGDAMGEIVRSVRARMRNPVAHQTGVRSALASDPTNHSGWGVVQHDDPRRAQQDKGRDRTLRRGRFYTGPRY